MMDTQDIITYVIFKRWVPVPSLGLSRKATCKSVLITSQLEALPCAHHCYRWVEEGPDKQEHWPCPLHTYGLAVTVKGPRTNVNEMLGLSFNVNENGLRRSHCWGGVGGSWVEKMATKLLGLLGIDYFPIPKLNPTESCLEVYNFQVIS